MQRTMRFGGDILHVESVAPDSTYGTQGATISLDVETGAEGIVTAVLTSEETLWLIKTLWRRFLQREGQGGSHRAQEIRKRGTDVTTAFNEVLKVVEGDY